MTISEQQFLDSIEIGDIHTVKEYVRNHGDLNIHNFEAWMRACEFGQLDIFKYMSEVNKISPPKNKLYPHDIYSNLERILSKACAAGHVHMVKHLFGYLSFDEKYFSQLAFEISCINGHIPLIQYILEHKMQDIIENNLTLVTNKDNYHNSSNFDEVQKTLIKLDVFEQVKYHELNLKMINLLNEDDWKAEDIIKMLENGSDIHYKNNILLNIAIETPDLTLLEFILSSPTVKDHIDPRVENDSCLGLLRLLSYHHSSEVQDVLKALCLAVKDPKDYLRAINIHLNDNKDLLEYGVKILNNRILNEKLQNELPNQISASKKKI